eukprot:14448319-Ditylum_brightwellii.AAC.1
MQTPCKHPAGDHMNVEDWYASNLKLTSDIKYIKGKANYVADVISRLNYSGKNDKELVPMSLQVISEAQEGCTDLQD